MRLHLVALPHTRVEPGFCGCAYTNKLRLFCKAMGSRHEILLYAPDGESVPGATLVPCLSDSERTGIFGQDAANRLPEWPTDAQSVKFNANAAEAIAERAGHGELIALSGGRTHLPITQILSGRTFCEPFVGYFGIIGGGVWAAFESYAHMMQAYAQNSTKDIRYFDTVIPPFCDTAEFPFLNNGRGTYALFIGRLIARKAPDVALEIAKAAGLPLYVVGAGATSLNWDDGKLTVQSGDVSLSDSVAGDIRYIGPVNIEQRAKLMAGAKCVICPTKYFEPGGNIAIESMLAGTSVITHDSGVFAETVQNGVSGFHFRLLREGVEAVRRCSELDPQAIRQYARDRFSLEAIAPKFEHWFERIQTLFGKGWYAA